MSTPITDAANAISNQSPAIKHFAQLVAAKLEPPAPVATFGGSLPPRMPEATGAVRVVSTVTDLLAALATVPAGSRIQLRIGTYGAGVTSSLSVKTNGTPTACGQVPWDPDDVIDLLVPALELSDEFRAFLEEKRLRQKYWKVQFGELIIDEFWDDLTEEAPEA